MARRRWLLIGALLLSVSEAALPSSSTVGQDFCARLASDSGIDKPAAPGGRTEWTVNAANFGQRFLVGGSFATGVGVVPIEPASVQDYQRLENMCLPDGKGAICKLVGPVIFKFVWKGRKVMTPMSLGERATILVAGTRTTCRPEVRS